MIQSELEFGYILRELQQDYCLSIESERSEFREIINHVVELLSENYWQSETENYFNTPYILDSFHSVCSGDELDVDALDEFISVIENLFWDLEIGDADDVFGQNGWKSHLGWDV